ncbi:50S ribosomal protein L9 [Neochlamydia sp. TUME1]|uniref:50S ribosomal protein L9 n=1 Tax=Neochlamydia sp. TUME1 TaxID=1478174 RepID=UPI00057F665D|nr:50S ribosomal protein L9 [Neochlamydia sp. TUME1]KIC74949.1 50S ribosomal protein L9 [Neochlamydia sp. TUME1]
MANKLLLLKDIETLGRSGDIVGVKPGYARNFLLPQGMAVVADKKALRMQARLQEERQKKAALDRQESDELAAKLEGQNITTIVKVDHEGHMYGSVSTGDIAELLEQQMSITLDKRTLQLKHAIKVIGVHKISVKLKEGVQASFSLTIEPEGKAVLPKEESVTKSK